MWAAVLGFVLGCAVTTCTTMLLDIGDVRKEGWRMGRISRLLFPSHGYCGKCQTTWSLVKEHTTMYSDTRGCFPLCEKCWRSLTIN